jgi:hypothetical protein
MVKIRRVLFLGYQNKQKSLLQWEIKRKKKKNGKNTSRVVLGLPK